MGDFTGFSFGDDWHSDDVNIIRVSGGDRYDESLHPEINDRTAEVPGIHGQYYFGSDYGQRNFEIEIAFDHLTETQFRALRRTFGTKEIKKLIFDERPYKYYMAKLESPIELSYVCFDEPTYTWEKNEIGYDSETQQLIYQKGINGRDYEFKSYDGTTQRIYKGEGKINFVCYFPFAKSEFKVLSNANEEADWTISSGILSANDYAQFDTYNSENGIIKIYNAGDIATGFRLYVPFGIASEIKLEYIPYSGAEVHPILLIKSIVAKKNSTNANDVGFLINTNNGLIQGIQEFGYDQDGNATYTTSGNLYNQYVDSGYFFKLEPNNFSTDGAQLLIKGVNNSIIDDFVFTYVLTSDLTPQENKTYYLREGENAESYTYTEVTLIENDNPYDIGCYEQLQLPGINLFYDYLYF